MLAITTLFIGLIGMGVIILRKIPVLAELSLQETGSSSLRGLRKKIKNNETLKKFFGKLLLQKILSKVKILTLKTESRTSAWLTNSRRRSFKKRGKFTGDYWKEVRKRK